MSADSQSTELAILAGQAAKEKKATQVIALDVSKRLILTDVFVLASGTNERQVRAIADSVDQAMSQHGLKLLRSEGLREARWVLLDYGAIVVHVQHEEDRQFYALERLWADAPLISIPDLPPQLPAVQLGTATLTSEPGGRGNPHSETNPAGESITQTGQQNNLTSAKANPVSPLDFLADNY